MVTHEMPADVFQTFQVFHEKIPNWLKYRYLSVVPKVAREQDKNSF